MAYLSSSKVDIFPISHKREFNQYARALSEEHLTQLIRAVVDKDSFVIEYVDNKLICVINGYVVSIDNPTEVLNGDTNEVLWAVVLVDRRLAAGDTTGAKYPILRGIDDPTTGKYKGLQLVQTSTTVTASNVPFDVPEDTSFGAEYEAYCLKILQLLPDKDSGSTSWQVPEESLHKIVASSIVGIDGGEV